MNKPEQKKPETDIEIEILVNAVMSAQHACNAASAALRSFLRKRAGGPSGGSPERPVPPTFMAKATKMVHSTDTPEESTDDGQRDRDGGGDGQGREDGDGSQDYS